MHARKSKSLVAAFVFEQIEKSKEPIEAIAAKAGMRAEVLKLIAEGRVKLAINQAHDFAKALQVEGIYLLRLLLEDYLPDSWSIIQDNLQELAITPYEQEVLDGYRRVAQGRDIAVCIFPAAGHVEVVPPSR